MQIPKCNFSEINPHEYDTIIDVRSPSEFNLDHVVGAINLPVLSDKERALVGWTYKQESRFKARKIGAALIARNTAQHLENVLFSKERKWNPLIYCWRGGQRSSAFSTILAEIGWRPTLLNGGYKNYRHDVSELLHKRQLEYNFILISGHTGTAKTEIIQALENFNIQIIDLEGLANHRGSVFGATRTEQPSQKFFESLLFHKLESLNPARPIILEAESNKIGRIIIPSKIWNVMKKSPRIEIRVPLHDRAVYLAQSYRDLTENQNQLEQRIEFLKNQHGKKKVLEWKTLSKARKFIELANELMCHHYDSRYKNSQKNSTSLTFSSVEMTSLTKKSILNAANKISNLIS